MPAFKNLRDRVDNAFGDATASGYGDQYLERISQNEDVIRQSHRRTVVLIAVLILTFLVVGDAKTAEFSLGPVKLAGVSSILTLIPALVAILYYEVVFLAALNRRCEQLRIAIISKLYPTLYANELHVFLGTPTASHLGTAHLWLDVRLKPHGLSTRILKVLQYPFVLALGFGGLGFLVYAYAQLFTDQKTSDGVVTASLVIAAISVARAIALVADEIELGDETSV